VNRITKSDEVNVKSASLTFMEQLVSTKRNRGEINWWRCRGTIENKPSQNQCVVGEQCK
jgi:hypothetical protein